MKPPVLESHPKHPVRFRQLMALGREISSLCKKANVTPIVYGSLAYFVHTQDPEVEVRDLDFLVSEMSFPNIRELLTQKKDLRFKEQPYHSIEVYKGGLEIDLDAKERFLFPKPDDATTVEIEGLTLRILNRQTLIDIYREAIDQMPQIEKLNEKRQRYLHKLANLEKKKTS